MPTKTNHGERLAKLEERLENESQAIRDHIDAKHELLLANLQPYSSLIEKVDDHGNQIARWRGVQTVLAFIFTAALAYLGIEKR